VRAAAVNAFGVVGGTWVAVGDQLKVAILGAGGVWASMVFAEVVSRADGASRGGCLASFVGVTEACAFAT
jgi:hypothetical protein